MAALSLTQGRVNRRMQVTRLPTRLLIQDRTVQPRTDKTAAVVLEYAEQMARNRALKALGEPFEDFPPVIAFREPGTDLYWLADGFHRVEAADLEASKREDGHEAEIAVEARPGGKLEAILYAAGANATHGLRRTSKDKVRSVLLLLEHPVVIREGWSDARIAVHAHVSASMVRKHRQERDRRLGLPPVTVRVGLDGKAYQTQQDSQSEPKSLNVGIESGQAFVNGVAVATVVSEPTATELARENGTYTPQARYEAPVERVSGSLADYEALCRALATLSRLDPGKAEELLDEFESLEDLMAHVDAATRYILHLDALLSGRGIPRPRRTV